MSARSCSARVIRCSCPALRNARAFMGILFLHGISVPYMALYFQAHPPGADTGCRRLDGLRRARLLYFCPVAVPYLDNGISSPGWGAHSPGRAGAGYSQGGRDLIRREAVTTSGEVTEPGARAWYA